MDLGLFKAEVKEEPYEISGISYGNASTSVKQELSEDSRTRSDWDENESHELKQEYTENVTAIETPIETATTTEISTTETTNYRTVISIQQKLELIREKDALGTSNKLLAEKYGIKACTVTSILKKRAKLENLSVVIKNSKSLRKGKFVDIERAAVFAFKQCRESKVHITGSMLKAKALTFAEMLNVKDFKGSEGWLERLKKRNALIVDSAAAEERFLEEWLNETLPELIRDYSPDDIYTFDEIGLFYKCTPNRTADYAGQSCIDGTESKIRLTVGLGVNWRGTDKLKLLVIGQSKNPKSSNVEYRSNPSAWLTSEICLDYFKELNQKCQEEGRKILMFMDSCPAHSVEKLKTLESIKFVYFSVNCASKMQPLALGIVRSFKIHYKSQIVQKMVDYLEVNENMENFDSISVLEAISSLNQVWTNHVSSDLIQNSFRKAGFSDVEMDTDAIEEDALTVFAEKSVFKTLSKNLNRLKQALVFDNPDLTANDFLDVDENLATFGLLTDEEILMEIAESTPEDEAEKNSKELENSAPVLENKTTKLENVVPKTENDDEDEMDTEDLDQIIEPIRTPTSQEVQYACRIFENFLLTTPNVPQEIFDAFAKVKSFVQ